MRFSPFVLSIVILIPIAGTATGVTLAKGLALSRDTCQVGSPLVVDSTLRIDPARVMRRTALSLGIRTLVQQWSGATTLQERRSAVLALKDTKKGYADAVAYALTPDLGRCPPSEENLRAAFETLRLQFPQPTGSNMPKTDAERTRLLQERVYLNLLDPSGPPASPAALSGAGVSFQQALIEGTTAFLVDRAKADLAQTGIRLLTKQLGNPADADSGTIGKLFSHTRALAADLETQRDPRIYLRTLQLSLHADLNALPATLSDFLNATDDKGTGPILAREAVSLAVDVQRGTHPLVALSSFARKASARMDSSVPPDLKAQLEYLNILTSVLYAGSVQLEGQEMSTRSILNTLDGRSLFTAYMLDELRLARIGSLWDKTTDPHGWPQKREAEIRRIEAEIVAVLATLDDIARELEQLRAQYDQIRVASPEMAASVYAGYIAVTTRAVRQVLGNASTGRADEIEAMLRSVERVLGIREAIVRGDYSDAVAKSLPLLQNAKQVKPVAERAGKLLTVAALIAESRSTEQVYSVLVLYAAPPGSYRDRRGSTRGGHLGIGAYVGGGFGKEWIKGTGEEFQGGAFLPVGLEISTGVDWGLGVRSLGLFLSPVNLGTYVNFSDHGAPEYSLAQMFSPAMHLALGLSETVPVTIGFGGGYIPEFRDVNGSRRSAWQYGVFLAVDVPITIWKLGN